MSGRGQKRVFSLFARHLGEIVSTVRCWDQREAAEALLKHVAEADFHAYACYELLEVGVVDRTKRGGVRSLPARVIGTVTGCTDPHCADHFHGHMDSVH